MKDFCKFDVDYIMFGSHHTALLTNSGQVMSMGSNSKGQFGYGSTKVRDLITLAKGLEDEQITVSKFN